MRLCLLWFAFYILSCKLIAAPLEITFWHSMAGDLGAQVKELTNGFNKSQSEYVIKPIYKGEYTESLTSFAAAFRAKQPPGIVQVFDVGTTTMLLPQGIIKPLHQLLSQHGVKLPLERFLPAIFAVYSKEEMLQAMPFNISLPIIYYNAQALADVGVNHENFPKTWQDLELLAIKLKKAGFACAYTSAYSAWIQIESFSALHGLPIMDSTGIAIYNNEAIIYHLERLKRWQESHYFEYGGRANEATILFTSGRCPLFSQSSGSLNSLTSLVDFPIGIAPMPLDLKVGHVRHNNVVGGAALWASANQSNEAYHGIALFYEYISRVEIQEQWHQMTGYIPLNFKEDIQLGQKSSDLFLLAKNDLANEQKKPLNMIFQYQLRRINDEALEAIFAGLQSPRQAIDNAVRNANRALVHFARNTSSKSSKNRDMTKDIGYA